MKNASTEPVFAIIGGGASGVIAAAHILQHMPQAHILMFEPANDVGMGIAYGTNENQHLLNVRASGMNAFPEQPDHFVNWLHKTHASAGWTADSFVPRMIYRQYLQALIAPSLAQAQIKIIKQYVIDIEIENDKPIIISDDGQRYPVDAALLATGNEALQDDQSKKAVTSWDNNDRREINPDNVVAIIGSGLSMVDCVLSLMNKQHKGAIHVFSRRGLIPRVHKKTNAVSLSPTQIPYAKSASTLLHWLREQIRDNEWRSLIDALRPYTQTLWQSLSIAEKRRFLRHLRPWWDVHRHRMAPEAFEQIEAARKRGQLHIHAARILNINESDHAFQITFRPRHQQETQHIEFDTLIDCRGSSISIAHSDNPLLSCLLQKGSIRPDETQLGLDVDENLHLIDKNGVQQPTLYAIGPITKGVFWEVIAIPDIRVQAEKLAKTLVKSLKK